MSIPIVQSSAKKKRIASPLIEVLDNFVGLTWTECDAQGNKWEKVRSEWADLHGLGIDDRMIQVAIEDDLEDEYTRCEVPVFHGEIEEYEIDERDISNETFRVSPEITEKLEQAGFEIIKASPSRFLRGELLGRVDAYTEAIPEAEDPEEPVEQPENPDMYRLDSVEPFFCPTFRRPFQARPLIYVNPHTGAESFFCNICKKAGENYPWHPCVWGEKKSGHDEQSVLTAIKAIGGDCCTIYEITQYCSREFVGSWDSRKVGRICDRLSRHWKIRYWTQMRNGSQVKVVVLYRPNQQRAE